MEGKIEFLWETKIVSFQNLVVMLVVLIHEPNQKSNETIFQLRVSTIA